MAALLWREPAVHQEVLYPKGAYPIRMRFLLFQFLRGFPHASITKGEGIWAAQSFRAQNALFPPSGILLCQNENKGQYTFVPEPVLPDSRFMGIFQIAFWHAMQWRPPLHAMRAFAKGFP